MKPPNGNDVVSWCLCPGEHCAQHHKPDCPCGDKDTEQGVEVGLESGFLMNLADARDTDTLPPLDMTSR